MNKHKLTNPVQIREDIRDKFMFSTDDGIEIDNDQIYSSRYLEDQFQVFFDNKWHNINGIDFEFINTKK